MASAKRQELRHLGRGLAQLAVSEGSKTDDPIANMRSRAAQFRRLADQTHDERMRWQLIDWANEVDADVERLEARRRSDGNDAGSQLHDDAS